MSSYMHSWARDNGCTIHTVRNHSLDLMLLSSYGFLSILVTKYTAEHYYKGRTPATAKN